MRLAAFALHLVPDPLEVRCRIQESAGFPKRACNGWGGALLRVPGAPPETNNAWTGSGGKLEEHVWAALARGGSHTSSCHCLQHARLLPDDSCSDIDAAHVRHAPACAQDVMSKCVEVVGDVFPDYDDFGKLACDALTASFPEWRNETLANIMCKLVALTVKHRKEAGQHGPAAHSTLDVVEYWSGVGTISKNCIKRGLATKSFDKLYHSLHDAHKPGGFRLWVLTMTYVKQFGFAWLAPTCSSWIWLTRSQTKRSSANPMGCEGHYLTRDGNASVVRVLILLTLSILIDVEACVEQPLSSLMPKVPAFARVLQTEGRWRAWERTFTWLGAFGGLSHKPTVFLSNASWVKGLRRKKQHGQPMLRLVTKKGKKVTGICHRLAHSAGYPEQLGETVADALADGLM